MRERAICAAGGILLAAAVDLIFYRTVWMMALLAPLAELVIPGRYRRWRIARRREQLASQFKDGVLALSAALQTGYSVENAWTEGWKEMASLYGEEGLITREFSMMVKAIAVHETPEVLIQDLADRSQVAEIKSFAEVFAMTKRGSGDLVTVMEHTAQMIHEKLRVREEILTQTAAKRLEAAVMSVMPAGMILYLNMAFDGFLDPLYEGFKGRCIMTGCLAVYAAAVWLCWYLVQPKD